MSLHNGIDTIGVATNGVYSGTYGAAEQQNICNLFASWGFLEELRAPIAVIVRAARKMFRLGLSNRL